MSKNQLTRNMEKLLKKLKKGLKQSDIDKVSTYLKQGCEISGSTFFVVLKSNVYDMFGEDYKRVYEFLELIEKDEYICSNFSNEALNFCQNIKKIYGDFLPAYQKSRENKNQMINELLSKNKKDIKNVLYYFEQLIFQEYKRHSNEKCLEIYSQFLYDTNLLADSIELEKKQEIRCGNNNEEFVKRLIMEYGLIIEFKNNFFDLLSGRYNFSLNENCYTFESSDNNLDLVSILYEANRQQRRMISLDRRGERFTRSLFRRTSLEFLYKDFGYKVDDEIENGITIQDIYNVWDSICEFVDNINTSKSTWLRINYEGIIKKDFKKIISKEQFYKVLENYFVSNIEKVDLYLYPVQKYKSQYLILNWGTDIEFTYLLNNIVPKVIDKKFYEAELIDDLKVVKELLFKSNNEFLVYPKNIEFKDLSIEIDLMFMYEKTLFIADVKHTMKKFESISNLRKLNYTYDGIIQVDYICKFIERNKDLFIAKLKKEKNIDVPDFEEVKGFLLTNEGKFSGVHLNKNVPILTREDFWRFFAYPVVLIQDINRLSKTGVNFIIKHWWDFSKVPSLENFLNYLANPFKDNFAFKQYTVMGEEAFYIAGKKLVYKKYKINYQELNSFSKYREKDYGVLIEQKINNMRNKGVNEWIDAFYVIDFTKKKLVSTVKDVKDINYWMELQTEFFKFDDTSNRK